METNAAWEHIDHRASRDRDQKIYRKLGFIFVDAAPDMKQQLLAGEGQ